MDSMPQTEDCITLLPKALLERAPLPLSAVSGLQSTGTSPHAGQVDSRTFSIELQEAKIIPEAIQKAEYILRVRRRTPVPVSTRKVDGYVPSILHVRCSPYRA